MAALLLPSIVIVTTCSVPSTLVKRIADVERLHRVGRYLQRVGPHAVRRHREGAVAAVTCCRFVNRREGIGQIVDVGIGELAGCGRRAVLVAIVFDYLEPVVSPEMIAASSAPLMVTVTSCGVPSAVVTECVGQLTPTSERFSPA